MPIYQRRVFSVVKPLKGVNSDDNVFTIPHTGEQFKDESEYRDRCELYAQEVWVCQCTGHTGLTHKEAWDSEHKIRNMLEASFPEFLHKPILSAVHHSTKSLDSLIDEIIMLIHSRFHTGEGVTCLKHDKARATVLDVTDPENVCSSPSSDKENKSGQSPAVQPNGRFPPAQLPLRYTVQLEQSGRIAADLPASELSRAERLPNREMLRLFVRSNAIRQGTSNTAPWVVSPHLFIQHGLKNKIASIFLPSADRKNGMNSSLPPKKRKLLDTPKDKPSKKPKSNGTPRMNAPKPAATNGPTPTTAKVPPKPTPPDSDSDCEILANIASSSKTKLARNLSLSPRREECRSSLSVVLSPLKLKTTEVDSDDSDDVKLSVIAKSPMKKLSLGSGSSPAKKALFGKGGGLGKDSGKGDAKKKEKQKVKEKEKKAKEKVKSKDVSQSKKGDSKKKQTLITEKRPVGRPRKDQKGMRQMSLFDLGKKVSSTKVSKTTSTPQKGTPQKATLQKGSSPQKKPSSPQKSPSKRVLPPCVRRLIRQLDAGKKLIPSSSVVKTCAKWLTHEQIGAVQNERARQLIERSRAKMDELRLMSRMTEAQKEEYIKRKKEEERRARFVESRKFFEDQTLQLPPLPAPSPVPLPPGLPAHLFGQAVMVAEFLHAYSALLVPAGGTAVPADQVLPALAGGGPHHKALLDLVTMMLKVVLSDGTAEDRKELSTPLRQVPVTPQTASELVRLALRPADADSDADSEAGDEDEEHLSESLLERLEQCELFELTTAERLEVLGVLLHRLLDTDSLADRHRDMCLRRDTIARDMRAQRRQEELAAAQAAAAAKPVVQVPAPTPEDGLKQGPAAEGQPEQGPAAGGTGEETEDLASRIKRSRRNVEQARKEREEKERERKEKVEKELEAERKALAEAALLREYETLKAATARMVRRVPLGSDRHHRRYWLFGSLPGALFVEDGWAARETLTYRVQPPGGRAEGTAEEEDEDDQPLKVVQRRCLFDREQTTAPEPADNRWFCYSSVAEVHQLRAALAAKGERESVLRDALVANDPLIRSGLTAKPEPVPEKSSLTEATSTAQPANNTQATPSKNETKAKDEAQAKIEPAVDKTQPTQAKTETAKDGQNDKEINMETDANANTEAKMEKDAARSETEAEGTKTEKTDEAKPSTKPDADCKTADQDEPNGYQFLISTLKEDILGIEEELSAGWLGAVPDPSDWADRVLSAETADQLGAAVLECERHIRREVLQGPLAPVKGAEGQSAGGQRWTDAVRACRTLSRLHVLVGLLDSAIRWDLSTAQKKCRVCRRGGAGEVSLCVFCKQLYHWSCLRPALLEPPGAEWQCNACRPVPPPQRRQRARAQAEEEPLYEESEEEDVQEPVKEKECRVCTSPDEEDMIFCTKCPAAFHKTCHEPPMLLRVRPGWECMDCKAPKRKKVRGRLVGPKPPLPSALLRQARANASEDEEDEEEEEEEVEEEGEEAQEEDDEEAEEDQEDGEEADEGEEEDGENDEEEQGDEEAAADETAEPAEEDCSDAEEEQEQPKSSSKKRIRRRPRKLLSDDEDEAPSPAAPPRSSSRRRPKPRRSFIEAESGSEEERLIRALSSDEEPPAGRRARRTSSVSRRAEVRARCRRQPRKKYAEKTESDLEPSEEDPVEQWRAAQKPSPEQQKPSPSKVEMVQQVGAVCMYCDLPSTRRDELAVCQSCPSMYHRRCAKSAGLVDAWQCRQCVLPSVYRARPIRPRTSEDFEYED